MDRSVAIAVAVVCALLVFGVRRFFSGTTRTLLQLLLYGIALNVLLLVGVLQGKGKRPTPHSPKLDGQLYTCIGLMIAAAIAVVAWNVLKGRNRQD